MIETAFNTKEDAEELNGKKGSLWSIAPLGGADDNRHHNLRNKMLYKGLADTHAAIQLEGARHDAVRNNLFGSATTRAAACRQCETWHSFCKILGRPLHRRKTIDSKVTHCRVTASGSLF